MIITITKSYREIDVLIAEHIFEWVKEEKLGMLYLYPHSHFSLGACHYWEPVIWNKLAVADFLPHFATQIQDSWQIIELYEKICRFHLSGFDGGIYRANFGEPINTKHEADTIQLAICLAALKLKNIEIIFGKDVTPYNPLDVANKS